jgi:hypothetical protein
MELKNPGKSLLFPGSEPEPIEFEAEVPTTPEKLKDLNRVLYS